MAESVTISKKTPASTSLRYEWLRDDAIAYIQRLSGKIWTDYNSHDPGVTILEVLCYAITELGYRASFDIRDILADNPDTKAHCDCRNFYTAREILPNVPVTIDDYRKILIDVDVYNPEDPACAHVGVKNAWIEPSSGNEVAIYVHKTESELGYTPDPHVQAFGDVKPSGQLVPGILYEILLEFETCDTFGDLNENSISGRLVIDKHLPDTALNGMIIAFTVDFPRWDCETTDWQDAESIRSAIGAITLRFFNVPRHYEFSCEQVNTAVKLKGALVSASDTVDVNGLLELEQRINDFIYRGDGSLLALYRRKIARINQIVKAVRRRLHWNRNLCEDFYRLKALKIEMIAVCADIELKREADVDEVQAHICYSIAKFLSPPVCFYTLDEMLDKSRERQTLVIDGIDTAKKCFSVVGNPEPPLSEGAMVIISNSGSNDGEYTVQSMSSDIHSKRTKIYVRETVSSDLFSGKERLSFYTVSADGCFSVDEIFEGPALDHGFIDNRELRNADRKKSVHVSDLVRIIMSIDGVVAVSSIRIANIPRDNTDGHIQSKSVRWCLDLACDQNYVPRLSTSDSKLTFYKDRIPFKASLNIVEELIDTLEKNERGSKLYDPVLDFPIPSGTYRDLAQYASIQNDFPLTYGTGDDGIPSSGSDSEAQKNRGAKSRQLKGYLMHFDQLLANYFSQLAHVRDLFSMNDEKDSFGRFVINRSYYTQPLFDIVPDADTLLVDKAGHAVALDSYAESETLFHDRKNRFLDHLAGRFAEQFTDYAMLTYKMSGKQKAPEELIEDKLAFLNAYPSISSERGKGLTYQEIRTPWHIGNMSGLRKRVSCLAGISEPKADELHFSSRFDIAVSGDEYTACVSTAGPELLLQSSSSFGSGGQAALALESLIASGICKENYTVHQTESGRFYFTLDCDNAAHSGMSASRDYPDRFEGGELDRCIDKLVSIFRHEYDNNTESSRNNLACAFVNYIQHTIESDMSADPPIAMVRYSLYSKPLLFNPADVILRGQYEIKGNNKSDVDIVSLDSVQKQIVVDGNIAVRICPGDVVVIDGSSGNDGVFTVVSATDVGGTTVIAVQESMVTETLPLSKLRYNNSSVQELLDEAEKQLPEIFWQLISNALEKSRYYFTGTGGDYRFRIADKSGNAVAVSEQADFNVQLGDEIAGLVSGSMFITGSTGNNGQYRVDGVTVDGASLTITLKDALPSQVADGIIGFTESFAFSVDRRNNALLTNFDLTGRLSSGDAIRIEGSISNDGEYRIASLFFDTVNTVIVVSNPLPAADSSGHLLYSRSFTVEAVTSGSVTFKGGYDVKSVERCIGFIRHTFFSREGFHVLEHILLRPKVKGLHFVNIEVKPFSESIEHFGTLYIRDTLPLFSASRGTNLFRVKGNLADLKSAMAHNELSNEIRIADAGSNDGLYRIQSIHYDSDTDRSEINVIENVSSTIPFTASSGKLSYRKGIPVMSVSAIDASIMVGDTGFPAPAPGEVIDIRGSSDAINDGRYLVESVIDFEKTRKIMVSHAEHYIEDRLLDIVLDDSGCDNCQVEDPYTCIASVILPHWQGRFDSMEFRRFFELQLRQEAPAHVFLNICWVSCRQMTEFEDTYRAWLAEAVREKKDPAQLSLRLNALIDIVGRLRNVYPTGVLHDCNEEYLPENAIILDNSVLGNA
jgi:hypothetical protein